MKRLTHIMKISVGLILTIFLCHTSVISQTVHIWSDYNAGNVSYSPASEMPQIGDMYWKTFGQDLFPNNDLLIRVDTISNDSGQLFLSLYIKDTIHEESVGLLISIDTSNGGSFINSQVVFGSTKNDYIFNEVGELIGDTLYTSYLKIDSTVWSQKIYLDYFVGPQFNSEINRKNHEDFEPFIEPCSNDIEVGDLVSDYAFWPIKIDKAVVLPIDEKALRLCVCQMGGTNKLKIIKEINLKKDYEICYLIVTDKNDKLIYSNTMYLKDISSDEFLEYDFTRITFEDSSIVLHTKNDRKIRITLEPEFSTKFE